MAEGLTSKEIAKALHLEELRNELKRLDLTPEFAQEVLHYANSRRNAVSAG